MNSQRINVTVCGIPCIAEYVYHKALKGAREAGTGLQLEPDEPAYVEVLQLYDRKGYKAEWLERKLDFDLTSVEDEIWEVLRDE